LISDSLISLILEPVVDNPAGLYTKTNEAKSQMGMNAPSISGNECKRFRSLFQAGSFASLTPSFKTIINHNLKTTAA
jgi:hypothetical protein